MIDSSSQTASDGTPSRVRSPQSRSLLIVLVEDCVDLASTKAMLLIRSGHEVTVCNSGKQALHRVESFRPQVVLTDIGLPDMDGFELVRQLRRLPTTARALHIALGGHVSSGARQRLQVAGFDHHVVKPCSSVEIDALLDAFSREGSAGSSDKSVRGASASSVER